MSSESAVTDGGSAPPQRLRIWLNAFIPMDLEGVEVVKAGAHAGKMMLPTPGPVDAWFLTDARGFSSDPTAPSRMHSEIELALPSFVVVREMHCCDDTVQIDRESGEELCREAASTEHMTFDNFQLDEGVRSWTCHLHGSTKNACLKVGPVKVSPNLDYDGEIRVLWDEALREIIVIFEGAVETYPAFEMYASVDHRAPVTILRASVEPGTTPISLAGPPTRQLNERAIITRG